MEKSPSKREESVSPLRRRNTYEDNELKREILAQRNSMAFLEQKSQLVEKALAEEQGKKRHLLKKVARQS